MHLLVNSHIYLSAGKATFELSLPTDDTGNPFHFRLLGVIFTGRITFWLIWGCRGIIWIRIGLPGKIIEVIVLNACMLIVGHERSVQEIGQCKAIIHMEGFEASETRICGKCEVLIVVRQPNYVAR